MPHRIKTVGEYLKELKENRKEKPPEVRQALEVYIDLWESVLRNQTVEKDEEIDQALAKLEAKGGLYQAASG